MVARVRRVLVVGATVAACGRVGFQARQTDGGAVDTASSDAPTAARLVGMTSSNGSSGGSQLAIAAITPGDVLVVAVTTWDGTPVASVTAGMPLTSAGARAVMGSTSSELWYAAPAVAASTVTVTMASSTTSFDVWAAEFEHIAPGAPLALGSGCLQYPPDVVTAPVTATAPGQLVFGATMLAAPAYVNAVAAPFTALPIEDGNGAAYYITTAAGSYGPSWTVGAGSGMNAMTCASTALFAPQ